MRMQGRVTFMDATPSRDDAATKAQWPWCRYEQACGITRSRRAGKSATYSVTLAGAQPLSPASSLR